MVDGWRRDCGVPVDVRENSHFLVTPAEFSDWADGRRELVLEHFYRSVRKRFDILMEGDRPVGGAWNFDKENREPFRGQTSAIPHPLRFPPDEITREVLELVAFRWPKGYGRNGKLCMAGHSRGGEAGLARLSGAAAGGFGRHQDAMVAVNRGCFIPCWHRRLNLQLLDPRECLAGAVEAWNRGTAPLNAVEGFVRQILGWREFIRGVYWHSGPDYGTRNALREDRSAAEFFGTPRPDMNCLRESLAKLCDTVSAITSNGSW